MIRQLFIFAIISLLLSACSRISTQTPGSDVPAQATIMPQPTSDAAELELTDSKKPVEAAAGDEFTITLRTNPVSGYHWELAEELDPKVVEYVWKDFVPLQPDMPNSTGKDIWRFKAVAPGEARIVLGYYMDMTEDSAEMVTFNVVVVK